MLRWPGGEPCFAEKEARTSFGEASFGGTKLNQEGPRFWELCAGHEPFDGRRTLFIDDNSACLQSARTAGIRYLLGVNRPDSHGPPHPPSEFPHIDGFFNIMPPVL